jgi:hypothetical protein
MIGLKLVGALVGRKVKEKAVDAVLDKVDLPDQVEDALKTAVVGPPLGMLGKLGKLGKVLKK